MKSHSIPSLLGIAAVLVAALVVAIAFGISTDSQTAQAQGATTIDYDVDGDTLIDVKTREQLEAITLDSSGTGLQGEATYDLAFPNAATGMGCGDDADNPVTCTGYELTNDITLSGDWTPIATYGGVFDGNDNTISGLTINGTADGNVGLFGETTGTVRNVGLVGVNITVTTDNTENGALTLGALTASNSGAVSNSYATGQITVTRDDTAFGTTAGGLVGGNTGNGTIIASYAAVSVSVTGGGGIEAGGLAGSNDGAGDGAIRASYATGAVSAIASGANSDANAGGLVANSSEDIEASYATGDVSATATGTGAASAGGLVGSGAGTITASYSTGAPTATVETGTASEGGLDASGDTTATNSYWNTDTSGIAATTTQTGVGTSTMALQDPTGYGTTTDIFGTWNLDIDRDATSTLDDPWDFGSNLQYPVLQYGGLDPKKQRPQVTLSLDPDTITTDGGTITVTATQDRISSQDTWLQMGLEGATTGGFIAEGRASLIIRAGQTSGSATFQISDVNVERFAPDVYLFAQVWIGVRNGSGADDPARVKVTITEPEVVVTMVENVRVRTRETLAVVTWDALDGATGYTVEWTSRVSRGVASWGRVSSMDVDGDSTSATVRRLVPGTDYGFRVSATGTDGSTSADVIAATEGEDDGASPFATMTPTPTPTPVATPIPPTTQVGTSTATTLTSSDGTVTLELPAGSRSEPYQVNFETATGCSYAGAKADVSFTCVSALIFDSDDILETDVEFDAAPTIAFHLTAEQVKALGGEFLLTKLHEMGGLMIVTRASSGDAWTALEGTTLTFDDESGGAVLAGWPASVTSFTAVAVEATYDTIQDTYGHLLPRDTLTPPTGGPSVPGMALLALLLGSVGLLAAGWALTARRSGA